MPVHVTHIGSGASLRERAIDFRKRGFSYSLISSRMGVAKSTLNYWLKNVPYKPNEAVLKRIRESSIKSAKVLRARRAENIRLARKIAFKELGRLTKRDLWMVGIGLYIGEGAKNKSQMIRVMNSDPKVINLAITWLKSVSGLDMKNFHIAIHIYPDLDVEKTLNFWSKVTGIPRNQFGKTQVDKRINKLAKNKGKSLFGTAHITVRSKGEKEYGVFLFRKIMGWIESIENQVNAGIVQW